ncbi:MAG: SRPBCC family protein [Nannocystales bacterium]
MIVVEQSLNTSATAQRMWEVLTDHESMPRWFPAVRSVTLNPPGREERNGLGAIRHVKAVGPTIVEEVVEWDAPSRYVYVLLRGAPIRDHRGEVTVVETPGGARATWCIRFRPIIPLSGLVLRPLMNRVARDLLRGAAKLAES